MMTTTALKSVAKTVSLTSEREPIKLRKRIGSTVYIAKVMYNPTATETAEDKILRIIEREVRNGT